MIAVRGKRLGGGTLNEEANTGEQPNKNTPEKNKPSEVVEVTLREEEKASDTKQEKAKLVMPSLADLAGGKKMNGGNPSNKDAKGAMQDADKILAREKASQERFLQLQQQQKKLKASGQQEKFDKKQRRRSSMEESNKNKNGVLEWTAWKRSSDASAAGLPDAPKKEASGPKPVNRRRYTVTLHQAWVGPASSPPVAVDARASKQRRRSTFEQSNKNQNGVLEWTAWKRNSGNGSAVGIPEEKKKASAGPRPVNRRQTITLHQAWVAPVATGTTTESENAVDEKKQERRGRTANRNAHEKTRQRQRQRRRSTLAESNKNKNGVLEWTAWKRPSDASAPGLDTIAKPMAGPRPVKRESVRSNVHQAWVDVDDVSTELPQGHRQTDQQSSSEPSRSRGRTANRNAHEKTKQRERRRSTLAESNKNKNGVLEWTAWKRPSDASAPGLDTTAKPMAAPRPVKRESVRSNVHHAWVDVEGVSTELQREFAEDEKKEGTPEEQQGNKAGNMKEQGQKDEQSTSDESRSATEKVKNWISRHRYHLLAAGVVTAAAIGVKMAFGGKKESRR